LRYLGEFDLDPCAAPSPRPWSTAKRHIELPENGLEAAWNGRVWLNPPYDRDNLMGEWVEKMAKHGSGIALLFARTDTAVWQEWIWPHCDSVLFISGRLAFYLPDGTRTNRSVAPSALIAWSNEDTEALKRSGIVGALVKLFKGI
jgi:hypothetical protein